MHFIQFNCKCVLTKVHYKISAKQKILILWHNPSNKPPNIPHYSFLCQSVLSTIIFSIGLPGAIFNHSTCSDWMVLITDILPGTTESSWIWQNWSQNGPLIWAKGLPVWKGSNMFWEFAALVNLKPNFTSSPASSSNFGLDLGQVHWGSGSNLSSEPNYSNTNLTSINLLSHWWLPSSTAFPSWNAALIVLSQQTMVDIKCTHMY